MTLMLCFMFTCIVYGLLVRQVGRRDYLVVTLLATAMTGLYFFTRRFMT